MVQAASPPPPPDVKRTDLLKRHAALKSERTSFFTHWSEITTFLLPRAGRYFLQDRNRGNRRHNSIIDRTGTGALNTLAAGMMAGQTSPARPWLRFMVADADLMKSVAVRMWLSDIAQIVLRIFAKGNTYRTLHAIYREMGAFGTGASVALDDFSDVMRQYPLTAGEYCIAQDFKGNVNTLYREFECPVSQVVREFGKDNCSTTVQNMFNRGSLDSWVPLVQAIEPRDDRDYTKRDNLNMPYRSVYFEPGGENDKTLREGGYEDFPALAPRWDVAGGDIYGNSPGMEALGAVKQLQQEQFRKSQGIDYMTKPPIGLPTSMKNRETDLMPGGVSFIDGQANPGTRNLMDVRLNLNDLRMDIEDVRRGINSAFFADLFLMIANSTNPNMTATEVAARQEEKMLMLGPVIERNTDELLNPLVSRAFHRALKAGLLPPAPPEIHGMELQVQYISVLAQAQRAIGTNNIDRFVGNLGQIAVMQTNTGSAPINDKFDPDAWVDIYSDSLGVDPRLIVANDKVALVRKQRAQAIQQQQQAQQANLQADTAQKLGNAPTQGGGSNALNDLLGMTTGYNFPSAQNVGA